MWSLYTFPQPAFPRQLMHVEIISTMPIFPFLSLLQFKTKEHGPIQVWKAILHHIRPIQKVSCFLVFQHNMRLLPISSPYKNIYTNAGRVKQAQQYEWTTKHPHILHTDSLVMVRFWCTRHRIYMYHKNLSMVKLEGSNLYVLRQKAAAVIYSEIGVSCLTSSGLVKTSIYCEISNIYPKGCY